MNRPRGLLIDIDGVLCQGEQAIAGASECLRWVIECSIPHCFITNTTSKPRRALVEKLAKLGIETDPSRIHTPLVATSRWLAEQDSSNLRADVRPGQGTCGKAVVRGCRFMALQI